MKLTMRAFTGIPGILQVGGTPQKVTQSQQTRH
ncbi:unnamed protein product [Protopolystoma xenopodis]|uniref:Uncharacterized protein n=1 Tax=Protopolystoma xenopodis TaxID=117903 RepID=A0A448WZF2_9PLAT|nr:unnamed protein product [Protopolystoma xenopodis]